MAKAKVNKWTVLFGS